MYNTMRRCRWLCKRVSGKCSDRRPVAVCHTVDKYRIRRGNARMLVSQPLTGLRVCSTPPYQSQNELVVDALRPVRALGSAQCDKICRGGTKAILLDFVPGPGLRPRLPSEAWPAYTGVPKCLRQAPVLSRQHESWHVPPAPRLAPCRDPARATACP